MTAASLDKRPDEVAAMFDAVARRYDITNDVLSVGQDRLWRRAMVAALSVAPEDMILDLAAGTGTSSQALADAGAKVVACDLSLGMMAAGAKRVSGSVQFVAGNATALPFADDAFDAVTISFGLRNIAETGQALTEMRRVTKPGGRLVICEFSRPTWPPFATVYKTYLTYVLPQVARLINSDVRAYEYLSTTIQAWPEQRELGRMMLAAGWRHVEYRNLTGGIAALHRGIA